MPKLRYSFLHSMRRILLLLVVCSFLFVTASASLALAQDESEVTGFKSVRLWIYPEYDDPRLLIMLEGQIVGMQTPVEVRFLVPSAAEMYSAGSMDAQGQYSGGPPYREPSQIAGWDEISYEVTTDTFRVEYYDSIIVGQPDKRIEYEFRWLYPISELEVVVQEPRKSSNFTVLPVGKAYVDNQGFNSYTYNYYGLDDNPPLQFEINYTKSDTRPSLSLDTTESESPLPLVIMIVTLCVVAGAAIYIFIKSRPRTRAARRYVGKSAPVRGTKGKSPKTRFCTQCGQSVDSSYQFCSSCGKKLK